MTGWFAAARFGMFIHWGHYAQRGIEASWPLTGWGLTPGASVTVEDYYRTTETFNPDSFDPREWARLARACGMQYAVLTAKHHDGWCLWDTKTTGFSVMHSPYGRDIVRRFVDAFRAEGIRPGLYFSLADWRHPDYPPFTDADRPYRFPAGKAPDPARWPAFVELMFSQVRELLTNYGEIAVLWFDGGWERSAEQWRAAELKQMILDLQPGIMLNDRLPGQSGYATPEQFVPAQPPDGVWETCQTMNDSWAYNPADENYKSARALIHTLCEVASKGGNLLLNVGPRGDGALPPEQRQRLEEIATWMSTHRESIIATQPGVQPWQFYGPTTRRGDTLFLHCLMRPYDRITLRAVPVKRVTSVRALGAGVQLAHEAHLSIVDRLFNTADPIGELTVHVPDHVIDDKATVIAVDFTPAPPR